MYFVISLTAHTGLPPGNTTPATSTTATTGKHRGITTHNQPSPTVTHKNLSVPDDHQVTIVTPVEEGQMTSPTDQAMRESSKHNEGCNMQC